MAWTNWPATDGTTDIQDYAWITQIPRAIRDRHQMLGEKYWPLSSPAAASGTITGLVDNGDGTLTLTDSSLSPVPPPNSDDGSWWDGLQRSTTDCTSGKYWVSVQCNSGPSGGEPYNNGSYDVIIERTDGTSDWYRRLMPWQVARSAAITNNTNNTLTFPAAAIADWITSKLSPTSLPNLIGANYIVIRDSGTWWHERWPDWPNDPELRRGGVSDGAVYADGTGYIRELTNSVLRDPWNIPTAANNSWSADQWAGKEILVAGGGLLRRLTISGNNANTLFIGGITSIPDPPPATNYSPAGRFIIGPANWRGYPGRDSFPIARWYGGKPRAVIAHPPDDSGLTTYARVAALDADRWEELESIAQDFCGSDTSYVNPAALDTDLFVSQTNMCDGAARAGSSRAVDLYKTIRGWQVAVEALVGRCIRPVDPTTELTASGTLPPYSRAQCFADCSINSAAATLQSELTGGGADTDQYFTVASAYYGADIYYQVTDSAGNRLVADGAATADASTGKVAVTSNQAAWAGASVVYSAGWTRKHPREFSYIHGVDGNFMPDLDSGGGVVDPPAVSDFANFGCAGVGSWLKRALSTGSRVYGAYGTIGNDSEGFTGGMLYRHVGDNWADGTLGFGDSGIGPTDPYTDHAYEGTHPKTVQLQLRADRDGTITSASAYSFIDATKHWWGEWFNGGTLATQSGTALAADASTLTTDATRNDSTNAASCWFQASRFVGFGSAYEGFTIEIDHDSGGGVQTYKRLITSTSASGNSMVVDFDAVEGVTFQAGDAWRIKEPKYKLNRWKDKRIEVTKNDSTKLELLAVGNDDQTIYVRNLDGTGLEFPLQTGWTYRILEYEPGGVWEFAATAPVDGSAYQKIAANQYWAQPAGNDARSPNPAFHANQNENEPNAVTSYGRLRHGDYLVKELFGELYAMLNQLRWIKEPPSWASRANPATVEYNETAGSEQQITGIGEPTLAQAKSNAETNWDAVVGTGNTLGAGQGSSGENNGAAPVVSTSQETLDDANDSYDAGLFMRYAYAKISGVPTLLAHQVTIWCYTSFDEFSIDGRGAGGTWDVSKWNSSGHNVGKDQWAQIYVSSVDNASSYQSAAFGGTAKPSWADAPTGGFERVTSGYNVTGQIGVIKFDVTGGLDFIA